MNTLKNKNLKTKITFLREELTGKYNVNIVTLSQATNLSSVTFPDSNNNANANNMNKKKLIKILLKID